MPFCASMQATEIHACMPFCASVPFCASMQATEPRSMYTHVSDMHVRVRARAYSPYTHVPYMCIHATMYHGDAYRHTSLVQDIFAPGDGFPCQRAQLLVCLACATSSTQAHVHRRTQVHTERARSRARERGRERGGGGGGRERERERDARASRACS
jgi:hypothetical protein